MTKLRLRRTDPLGYSGLAVVIIIIIIILYPLLTVVGQIVGTWINNDRTGKHNFCVLPSKFNLKLATLQRAVIPIIKTQESLKITERINLEKSPKKSNEKYYLELKLKVLPFLLRLYVLWLFRWKFWTNLELPLNLPDVTKNPRISLNNVRNISKIIKKS